MHSPFVNKRFSVSATRFFMSHSSLTFNMSSISHDEMDRKLEYCAGGSEDTRRMLSRVTGVRLDLRLSQTEQSQPLSDENTRARRDHCSSILRKIDSLRAPLSAVTALELRMDDRRFFVNFSVDFSALRFVANNLPNLAEVYIECASRCEYRIGSPFMLDTC